MSIISIKNWALEDRPREKLMLKGRGSVSNAELLAIIIGGGTNTRSALEIAKEILNDHDNCLHTLAKLSIKDFQKYNGIGEARAISLFSVFEIARRKSKTNHKENDCIKSSNDAFNYLFPFLSGLSHEEFYIVLLNRRNEIITTHQISKGGISGTVADGKVIFQIALSHKSSALILAHNHPSGQCFPSESDKKLTKSLVEFGKLIDLPVLDHIIFTEQKYFSFADEGLI